MSRFRFGIMGGDYRYKILLDLLLADGYSAKAYCNRFISSCVGSVEELLEGIDVLIAPIPCTKDDSSIFLTDCSDVSIAWLMEEMYRRDVGILIGGVVKPCMKIEASPYNIKVFDFFEQEEVAILNAIPTAEGAIQTAMQESENTIFASKALVLGYGRCGKILANMLKGMGAEVSATYRNEKDGAYIKAYGLKGFNLSELTSYIAQFDFVFNTIPAEVIGREILKKMSKSTIIIDLAQAPGGVDFNYARDLNIKALYCPGLPGRVAPVSAAKILKEAVLNISLSQLNL